MKAPNPDGSWPAGSGAASCSISDLGVGASWRQIYIDTVSTTYSPGDQVIITGAPTMSGEYTVKYFFGAGNNQTYVDFDGTTQTISVVAPNGVIITTMLSNIPGGRDE